MLFLISAPIRNFSLYLILFRKGKDRT